MNILLLKYFFNNVLLLKSWIGVVGWVGFVAQKILLEASQSQKFPFLFMVNFGLGQAWTWDLDLGL